MCPVQPRSGRRRAGSAPTDGIGRVVVGVDGSAESLLALQFAAEAARLRGAPLEVVHVWQDTDHAAHGRLLPLGASAKAQADREWQNILRSTLVVASGVEIISSHVAGYAQSVLLKASEGAALLVVGRGGRGGRRDSCWIGVVALRHLVRLPGGGDPCSCDWQGLRDADADGRAGCVWPRPAPPPGTKHRTATPSPPDPSAAPPRVGAAIAECAVATVPP